MSTILVTGTSVSSKLLRELADAGCVVDNPTHLLSEDELAERLASCDGYLLGGDEYASRRALSSAKNLKIIAFLGMGYQSFVDTNAATEFGIAITNTPGTLSNSVAEFTIGLILNSSRKLYLYASEYAAGAAGNEEKQHDLSALQVGIIGLGGIGVRVAEMLRHGFGSRVSYFSRTRKQHEEIRLDLKYLPLSELVASVDVLVLATPATPETVGLIAAREFASVQPGLLLVNPARPELVDPGALLDALENGRVAYAAFDGFYDEGDLVSRLKAFVPNRLMITGHIASLTHEARDAMARKAIRSILNVLATGKDSDIVNPHHAV